jgi:hypothetical protein
LSFNNVTGENIGTLLQEHVETHAQLMTDSSTAYTMPGKAFASHETVNHSAGEYVRGDARSNTVEGFFSQFKWSLDGTFHRVSDRRLNDI